MRRTRVYRWSVSLVGTLVLVAVGLLYGVPQLLVLAVVPLGYVAYGSLSAFPVPTVRVERSLSPTDPAPGEPVTVTLTVENTGDRALADVRVVDGVPESLAVADGSPRGCLSLPAGASGDLQYDLVARRGDHAFDPARVRCRSLSGARVVTAEADTTGADSLTCAAGLASAPPRRAVRSRVGTVATDSGGPGLAFHSVREYRPGDPVARIDWRRFARTDELSTVTFRQEQAARVVLLVDVRGPARVAPEPGFPTAAELSVYAAERACAALRTDAAGATVTAAALDDDGPSGPLVEGRDPDPAAMASLFDDLAERAGATGSDAATDPDPLGPDEPELARRLLARLPPDAQVLVCSPLLEDLPVDLVATLRSGDVPVTVLSPSVTGTDTPGARVAALHREDRLETLRARGVSVVDWTPADPLSVALDRSLSAVVGP